MKEEEEIILETEGSEYLVLGHLLIEGILAYKAHDIFHNHHIIAVNSDNHKVIRIQVKSRWAADYDGSFPMSNFDCEFVIHVALNRGYRFKEKHNSDKYISIPPTLYIFPINVLHSIGEIDTLRRIELNAIKDVDMYINNWDLIKKQIN